MSLSVNGLWGAWNVLAKGTLGVAASVLLAATTELRELLLGLQRLQASAAAGADRVLHDPLRRRHHGRDAADADRPGVTRLRGEGRAALGRARQVGGRAVHPLLRARRARAPGHGQPRLRRLHAGHRRGDRVPRAVVVRPRPALCGPLSSVCWDGPCDCCTPSLDVSGLAFAYPDGHQALFGVDFSIARGERVALLGPNGAGQDDPRAAPQRHPDRRRRHGAVAGLPVDKRHMAEIRRRVGIVFQDPDDQLFMPTVREDVAFGPAAAGLKGPELEERVDRALERVGMAGVQGPAPAPSLLRAAPPGGGGDRAGDGAGDPGPRRALLQPRPRLPPRTGRHPALAGRDRPDGHARPPLRAGAVPARPDPQRRA